ncbi:MAG: TIGR02300 family protein [Alphaproteobacteria bacterium]|nr:TIGR02300 family protein [Alphaproteobacteria bacterium]
MGTADARGTKRTCQNDDCGARFYDLNRDPILCPNCEAEYVIAHAPPGAVISDDVKPKDVKRPKPQAETEEVEVVDGELADIEAVDAIPDDDEEDDDTFLEDEEDDEGNVVDIIPGIADGESEET